MDINSPLEKDGPDVGRLPSVARSAAAAVFSPRSPATRTRSKAATTTPVSRPRRNLQAARPQQKGHVIQSRTRTVSKSASPVRRRVTRSQSRELGTYEEVVDDHDGRPGRRDRGKGKVVVREMDTVIEEPTSGTKCLSGQQLFVPESPEDHNISGTTFLPTDSEPEFGDVDAMMMIEALPDLQRAAAGLLDFLVPPTSSKLSDVETLAGKLEDPRSSQSRKLERLSANLSTQVKYFGGHPYIDVPSVSQAFPTLPVSESKGKGKGKNKGKEINWHVSGILYKANCARLALDLLTCSQPTEIVEIAMYSLEGRFPLPFLSDLAREVDPRDAGISRLRRQTFDLALDIRTQFLRIGLDSRGDDPGFNPDDYLDHIFYQEALETQIASSGGGNLRGFTISALQDPNGALPSKFQDDVEDRIAEIRECFVGGLINFKKFDDTFSWSGFIYGIARWLRLRNEEINQHLAGQVAFEDIQQLLQDEINQQSFQKRPRRSVADGKSVDRPISPTQETLQQPPRGLLPAAEIKEKKTLGRLSFLNPSAIRALLQREERLNSIQLTPQGSPAQENDLAGFISHHTTREPESNRGDRVKTKEHHHVEPAQKTTAPPHPSIPVSQPPTEDVMADSEWEPESPSNVRISARHNPQDRAVPNIPSSQEAAVPLESSRAILAVIQRHKAALAKKAAERRQKAAAFIDRQITATRVSPISENSQLQNSGQKGAKINKRVLQDESDDDEFSHDNRRIDIATKRAKMPGVSKRRRRFHEGDSEQEIERQLQSEMFPSSIDAHDASKRRSSTLRSHDDGRGERSVSVSTDDLAESARIRPPPAAPSPPVVSRTFHPPSRDFAPPNVRRRWTKPETERLIQLMAKLGPHWVVIKREDELTSQRDGGPLFTGKDPQQIKDRARNMVLEFYRTHEPLPKNFENVTIKQVDKDRLRSLGIKVKEPKILVRQRSRR